MDKEFDTTVTNFRNHIYKDVGEKLRIFFCKNNIDAISDLILMYLGFLKDDDRKCQQMNYFQKLQETKSSRESSKMLSTKLFKMLDVKETDWNTIRDALPSLQIIIQQNDMIQQTPCESNTIQKIQDFGKKY